MTCGPLCSYLATAEAQRKMLGSSWNQWTSKAIKKDKQSWLQGSSLTKDFSDSNDLFRKSMEVKT